MKKFFIPLSLLLLPTLVMADDMPLTLSGGSGTADDPYLLSTKADLMELATACNTPGEGQTNGKLASHYQGVFFKMTADIDVGGDSEFIGIATAPAQYMPGNTWKFQGTFDGDGHTISGISIHGTLFDDTGKAMVGGVNKSRNYVGLFGYVEGGCIKNVNIAADCHFDAYTYVGSIAGQIDKGTTIENCSSLAEVVAYDQYAGGIVGRIGAVKTSPVTVSECYFGGSASACNANVGGIVGYTSDYTTLTGCTNTGSVRAYSFNSVKAPGNQNNAGGIAGNFIGTMDNCFNAGTVYADKEKAGGLAGTYGGKTSTITACVSIGYAYSPAVATTGVLAGSSTGNFADCYFDTQMWGTRAAANSPQEGVNAVATSVLTSGSLPEGLAADKWVAEAGYYPYPAGSCDKVKRAAATYLLFADGQAADNFKTSATVSSAMSGITAEVTENTEHFAVSGSTLSVTSLDGIIQGKVKLSNGDYSVEVPLVAVPDFFTGNGTEEAPYIIDSKEALLGLANLCNSVKMEHFAGCYFKQTADIDLTGTDFPGIAIQQSYATAKDMLYYFCGNYDGGGHTISGVNINGVSFSAEGVPDSKTSYAAAGLFGAVRNGAVIKGVNLDSSCSIIGYNNVGGIAGEVGENVTIADCSVGANLTGYKQFVGGIAGHNTVDSKNYELNNINIASCVFSGSVLCGGGYAGGIVGSNDAVVTNCVNGGTVTVDAFYESASISYSYAGGITGYNGGSISGSINMGKVSGEKNYVGGIAGQNQSAHKRGYIYQCVNAGQVQGQTTPGSIVGNDNISTTTTELRSPNWNDDSYCSVAHLGTNSGKGTHVSATNLSSVELTSGNAIEGMEGYSLAAGRYPLPETLAENPAALAVVTTYLNLLDNETISNFTEGTLNTTMPLTATVDADDPTFYVLDGKVLARPVTEVTSGTVVLHNGSYDRPLVITTIPGILPGNGTELSPYQISSAADFTKLADAIESSGFDYAGRYFILTADIDFTDTPLVPVGSLNKPFNGFFDGAGHSISNVKNLVNDETMQRERALFGHVGIKGVISNIKLTASDIRGNLNTGGIVGMLAGRVENCSVAEDCNVYSLPSDIDTSNPKVYTGDYSGGIAGFAAITAVITDCENNGQIVAQHQSGGIVGGSDPSKGAVVTRCVNNGQIGGTAAPTELFSGNAMVGGIAGRFAGTITECRNHGNVMATQMNCAGGIVGNARPGTLIEDCENYGKIETNWFDCGGIIGNTEVASAENPVIVTRCANHGVMNSQSAAAGIIGMANNGTRVTFCHNTADFINREGAGAAGIIAQAEGEVEVSDCYNTGNIAATRGAAGILGEAISLTVESPGVLPTKITVTRCFNTGEISAKTELETVFPSGASGIAGTYGQTATLNVSDCYNAGTIVSFREAGGITGTANLGTISNCYNSGKVTAERTPGNIVGRANSATVTNCFIFDECEQLESDGETPRMDVAQLSEAPLGDSFVYQTACLPRLKDLDMIPEAVINSARYLVNPEESAEKVVSPVTLAQIEGLTWTAEGPVEITDGLATPTDSGEFTLTAKFDELERSYKLVSVYDPVQAGLDDISVNGKEIVGWLDLSGRPVASPASGTVAIALMRDASGNISAVKVLVK